MNSNFLLWTLFNLGVISLLALDLGVFHRKSKVISIKQALIWSAVWIALALVFNVGIYYSKGPQAAIQYLTCYLLEKSLSVDNVFVFLMIFSYFRVPAEYQHRVLFYGIFGALLMRAFFILTGVTLINRFHWIIYIFGAFLIFTGIKFFTKQEDDIHPERNPILRLFRRFIPVSNRHEGDHFFIIDGGKRMATPLFVTLLMVEMSDIVFAVDSIPAAFGVTLDPFIIYSANVFAILGLRALFFAVAGLLRLFHYLNYGLAVILIFVGVKMLIQEFYKVPIAITLGMIVFTLAVCIGASLLWPEKKELKPEIPPGTGF